MDRRQFLADGIAFAAAAWATSGTSVSETLAMQPAAGSQRLAALMAKPAQIEIDLAKTAVIVVDMQNDFCSKGGVLDHEGVDLAIVGRLSRQFVMSLRRLGNLG